MLVPIKVYTKLCKGPMSMQNFICKQLTPNYFHTSHTDSWLEVAAVTAEIELEESVCRDAILNLTL